MTWIWYQMKCECYIYHTKLKQNDHLLTKMEIIISGLPFYTKIVWLVLLFVFKFCQETSTVYPKKYAHGFVVLCFVVVMQSFIMNLHEVFVHIHQGCFAGTGAIVRLPQCQWSKPGGYGKISPCITTTKHSKAKTVCIFLGIYCNSPKNMISGPSWMQILVACSVGRPIMHPSHRSTNLYFSAS